MYESYWKLKEKPFKNIPDPKYFYPASQYEDAFMKMSYAIFEDFSGLLLTGIFGSGKTLLLNYLEREMEEHRIKFIKVSNPQGDRIDILRNIVRQVASQELPYRKSEIISDYLLELFESKIKNYIRDGIKTVITVDEAHLIKEEEVFEQLRLFLNYHLDFGYQLTLIMAGQPELKQKVSQFRQIEQRISLQAELASLSLEELEGYINYRLKIAGAEGEIFEPGAYEAIYTQSAGIPRRINTICDLSLLRAMGLKKKKVDLEVVETVVREFLKDATL